MQRNLSLHSKFHRQRAAHRKVSLVHREEQRDIVETRVGDTWGSEHYTVASGTTTLKLLFFLLEVGGVLGGRPCYFIFRMIRLEKEKRLPLGRVVGILGKSRYGRHSSIQVYAGLQTRLELAGARREVSAR